MKRLITKGIVLARTDYGEADRIITVITSDQGKLRLIAKGVRKSSSKMAGGIELFSVSEVSFIQGKGDMGTLVSSRLSKHYGTIVQDINRTMFGYELLKRLNKATEDAIGPEYFDLLESTLSGLDESRLDIELLDAWFNARLLRLSGHQPNLTTDQAGGKLQSEAAYAFDFDNMTFSPKEQGSFTPNHIKLLRLLFNIESPEPLMNIKDMASTLPAARMLVTTMANQFIRL